MTTPLDTGAAPVANSTPDLSSYYLIHRALRDGAGRLAQTIRLAEPGTDRERVQALRRWYSGFAAELLLHHRIEETIHFPALAERVPAIAGHEQRLAAEHAALLRSIERVQDALAQLAAMPIDDRSHTEAVAASAELRDLLDRHLEFEDVDILPLFVRHFSGEEYQALDAGARNAGSLRMMAFTVPFVAEAATPVELGELLELAPLLVRLVLVVNRGRYRRLVAAAFG